jgi:gas vesicle protein
MKTLLFFLCGLAAGAAAGILLAPQSGRETRASIKDKSLKYSQDVTDYAGGKARHVADKAKGYAHGVKEAVRSVRRREKEVQFYI